MIYRWYLAKKQHLRTKVDIPRYEMAFIYFSFAALWLVQYLQGLS